MNMNVGAMKLVLAIVAAVGTIAGIAVIGILSEAFAVTGTCGRSCTGGGGSQAGSHVSEQGRIHMSPKGAEHSGICSLCT